MKMLSQQKISVALCTYNGTRYLQEQLDSIAIQTRQPLELVVGDDCSTDGTIEMLRQFAASCGFPVRIYQNEVQLGSTRNFDQTIRRCQGDYIALSDQDDRWRHDKLAKLSEIMDADEAVAMVFSDARLIDDASQPTGHMLWATLRFPAATQARFVANPAKVLLERPVVTGATMLFRRTLLKHFAEVPLPWVHDGWITWMSVLWAQTRFTDELLTDYRVHASQQLGVGAMSARDRLAEIRRKQRTVYEGIATEFDLLMRYVEQAPELTQREYWQTEIARTAAFFHKRAKAPNFVGARLLFVLLNLRSYKMLSSPVWRIMVRDLFMGKSASR